MTFLKKAFMSQAIYRNRQTKKSVAWLVALKVRAVLEKWLLVLLKREKKWSGPLHFGIAYYLMHSFETCPRSKNQRMRVRLESLPGDKWLSKAQSETFNAELTELKKLQAETHLDICMKFLFSKHCQIFYSSRIMIRLNHFTLDGFLLAEDHISVCLTSQTKFPVIFSWIFFPQVWQNWVLVTLALTLTSLQNA